MKPWSEMTWDEKFENVEMRANYWTEGGRAEPDKARAILNVEQATFAWKNAAYAAKEALTQKRTLSAEEANNLWTSFLKEIENYYGCVPLNFLGSVEKHKEFFDKAVEKL